MMKLLELFGKFDLGRMPWDYDLLLNLDESEYPKYLSRIFYNKTGEKLPLSLKWNIVNRKLKTNYIINKKKCKTFRQKIQWLKLYDATPLKKMCTDKVLIRDYISERIGQEYLKPVLQIITPEGVYVNPILFNSFQNLSNNELIEELYNNRSFTKIQSDTLKPLFDQIDFDKLPNCFIMKCSHGCKWHHVIKNKVGYLNTKPVFELTKRKMTNWLEQDYTFFSGFELQYHGLTPKIIIEPLLRDDINTAVREIEIYCFNGMPKIYVNVRYSNKREITVYNDDYSISDLILTEDGYNLIINEKADDLLKKAVMLSKRLACTETRRAFPSLKRENDTFKFVRVDWIVYKNRLYFNELTFSPYSGINIFKNKWNLKLGKMLKI